MYVHARDSPQARLEVQLVTVAINAGCRASAWVIDCAKAAKSWNWLRRRKENKTIALKARTCGRIRSEFSLHCVAKDSTCVCVEFKKTDRVSHPRNYLKSAQTILQGGIRRNGWVVGRRAFLRDLDTRAIDRITQACMPRGFCNGWAQKLPEGATCTTTTTTREESLENNIKMRLENPHMPVYALTTSQPTSD